MLGRSESIRGQAITEDGMKAEPTGRETGGRSGLWPVTAALALLRIGATLPTPLYVIYSDAFRFSKLTLTLIFAVYVAGSLGALFFLGRLADQIGRRRVVLPAVALAAVSALLFLFAIDETMLIGARLLGGLAIGVAAGAGTAWIAELEPDHDRRRATLITVVSTMGGVGSGPLISGLLADFAPWPLRLPFIVDLALLGAVAALAYSGSETVAKPVTRWREISLRPRIGVPHEIRSAFVPPALTAFGTYAMLGFYTSLVASLIKTALGIQSHAVDGAVVFEMYVFAIATVLLTRNLPSRKAMLIGLGLLFPSLGLLVLTREVLSLPVLLCDSALTGVAVAFGYRGSLQVVNEIAPEGARAEVLSSYFVVAFTGTAIPVIGVGVLSQLYNAKLANVIFAATIGAFAILALIMSARADAPAHPSRQTG
jgi:MFS family permease